MDVEFFIHVEAFIVKERQGQILYFHFAFWQKHRIRWECTRKLISIVNLQSGVASET